MSAEDKRRNMALMVKIGFQIQEVFDSCAEEALKSIQSGSPITGAPGQPVRSGELLASWELVRPSKDVAIIGTKSPYARAIEHGTGPFAPMVLRSKVGGWHSAKLTAAGMRRILAVVTRRVQAGGT